ncbi:MAG: oxygen-independent coproporphyrinogen III oxidase [Gammaproteobacteria bacterium]|nr:oxygen-independent coproporphyrinogen III oxidase [Gammaproteobacteria bacterium]
MSESQPVPSVTFDPDLIRRYDRSGPRYTSYPTAVQFHSGFKEENYRAWAQQTNEEPIPRPLSLYFHVPFCDSVCYYCGCNKIVTKNRAHAVPYLERLHREVAMQGALFDRDRPVEQLHWGGGTPTFLSTAQMEELMAVTRQHFNLRDGDEGEYSIEIDPREADAGTIALLRRLGFNRMSLGVQDFDPRVQKAVNRIQTYEETMAVLNAARDEGFRSISVDLIYGLPFQSVGSFKGTLDTVIEASPDRISVFNYAHLPELFKTQRQINASELPSPAEKLDILAMCIERLTAAGYVFIGMDHFAKPDDELAVAQRSRTLYRNFQGYSTHANCDLVGLGITAIGMVGESYSQNVKTTEDYYAAIDAGHLPILRGVELTPDDRLRRRVITELICHYRLDFEQIEREYPVRFQEYFAPELQDLKGMEADGLLTLDAEGIRVGPRGKLLIRNVCMTFDRYLREKATVQRFSKVI